MLDLTLGGENANNVHIQYFRKKNKLQNDYENICFNALKKDLEKNNTNTPNFYAMVIKSKSSK